MAIRLSDRSLPFLNTGVLAKARRRRRTACLGLGLLFVCGGALAEELELVADETTEITEDTTLRGGSDTIAPRSADGADKSFSINVASGAFFTVGGFADNIDEILGGGVFRLTGGAAMDIGSSGGSAVFAGNSAPKAAGGVFALDGAAGGGTGVSSLKIDSVTGGGLFLFADNSAKTNGGAIYANNGKLELGNVSFYGNVAATGGAIYAKGAETVLTVKSGTTATFTGNVAKNPGDGTTAANSIHLSGSSLTIATEAGGVLDMRDPISSDIGATLAKSGDGTWKLAGTNRIDGTVQHYLGDDGEGNPIIRNTGTAFDFNAGTIYLYAENEAVNPNYYSGDGGEKARTETGSLIFGDDDIFQMGDGVTLVVSGFGHKIRAAHLGFGEAFYEPDKDPETGTDVFCGFDCTDNNDGIHHGFTTGTAILAFDLRGSDGDGVAALYLDQSYGYVNSMSNIGAVDIANPKWSATTTLIEGHSGDLSPCPGQTPDYHDCDIADAMAGLPPLAFRGEKIVGTRADGLLWLDLSENSEGIYDILLLQTGPAPANSSNLTWTGGASGNQWNINDSNWSGTLADGSDTPTNQFLHGDAVTFDPAAATGAREIAVNSGGVVVESLTFNGGDWTFRGGDILSSLRLAYEEQDRKDEAQLHPALAVNGTGTLAFDQRTFSEQWLVGNGSDVTVKPVEGATLTFSNPLSNIIDDGIATIPCGSAIYVSSGASCHKDAAASPAAGKISVENALFTENQVSLAGGAVYADFGGEVAFTDTSFVGNHSGARGGAVSAGEGSRVSLTVTNDATSLFSGNTAGGAANSIDLRNGGTLTVDTQVTGVLDMRDPMSSLSGGAVSKEGTGTWKLAGDNAMGSLAINGGTLYLYAKDEEENPNNKRVSGGSGVGAAARTDAGSLKLDGAFTLGTNSAPATLAVSGGGHAIEAGGGLSFYSGNTLSFDLDGAEKNGGAALTLKGTVDTDAAKGLMTVGSGRIDVLRLDPAARANPGDKSVKYVLVQADDDAYLDESGDLYIDGTPTVPRRSSVAGDMMVGLSLDEEKNQLSVVAADATLNTRLTWTGAVDKAWDRATENWDGRVEGLRVKTFLDGDDVVFQTAGALVNVTAGGVTANSVDVKENLTLSGGIVNAASGFTVAQGKVLTVGTGTTDGALAGAVALSSGSKLVFDQNVADGSFGGTVSGAGDLVKTGSRKLVLTGENTYTGKTTVSAGTLEGNIASGTDLEIAGGAVYDGAGTARTVGALSGAGAVKNTAGLTVRSGDFSGAIDDTNAGLTKVGAGTLTLSGANSYTGATTVREGTLALAGEGSISKRLAMYGGTAFVAAGAPVSLSSLEVHGSATYTGDLDASGGSLRFYVPATMGDGGVLLKVSGAADVTGADVNVGVDGASTPLEDGDTIALISSGHLVGGIANENAVVNGSGMQGVTKLLDFTVYTKGNDLLATVGTRANPRSKAVSEGYLAGVAMLDQGAELVAGQGLGMAADNAHLPGWRLFGAGAGGSVSYATGAELNLDGVSLISGASSGFDLGGDMLAVGGFFEYGLGDYGTLNTFDGFAPVSGRGDAGNIGGGGLAHLRLAGGDAGHAYIEASGRAGALHNRYASADLVDFSGRGAGYDVHLPYYGVHAGGGYVWNALENATVNVYGKYFLTRLEEGEVELSSGEGVRFEAVRSERVRVGARLTYTAGSYAGFYGGGAWERAFGGEARGSVGNFAIEAPSLAGDSGVWEGGVTLKPSPRRKIALELGVQGYVGVRKGNTLSARVSWDF